MATKTTSKSSRDKVRAYRKRLRQQGLRPIQIWVPDVTSPEFVKEARRQSRAVARSAGEQDDLAFIDSLYDCDKLPDWDER
jgi:hypothetical protein